MSADQDQTVVVRIDRLSTLGEGVVQREGRALFVSGGLPGEELRVVPLPSGKVQRARLVEVLTPSPDRRAPACASFGVCGGCDLQHASDELQRRHKEELVLATLEHLGGIDRGSFEQVSRRRPAAAAAPTMGYRRRAVLHAFGDRLGFFGRRSHERVGVDDCPALVDDLRPLVRDLAARLTPIARDVDAVTLLSFGGRRAAALALRPAIAARHRQVAEVARTDLQLAGCVLTSAAGGAPLAVGDPALRAPAPCRPGVPLYARPDTFAQANAWANEDLVHAAIELLAPESGDRALELYSGHGNFSLALEERVAALTAVEGASAALDLARRSVREAGLKKLRFIEGDVGDVCEGLVKEGRRFDLLFADPPRTGAPGLARWARGLRVRTVVLVACDVASLAREAAALRRVGYAPCQLAVIDMFPQTRHVEAIMSFKALPPEAPVSAT